MTTRESEGDSMGEAVDAMAPQLSPHFDDAPPLLFSQVRGERGFL